MSTAKDRYCASITRCNRILETARVMTDSDIGDEMRRFSIVLAVAAFDSFVADRFSEHCVSFLRNAPKESDAVKFLDRISFGTKEMLSLLCEKKDRPFRTIHASVDQYLGKSSFQSEKPINALFTLYGLPHFYGDSVKKAGGEFIRKRVEAIIHRRHDIAHACDCNNNGHLRPINDNTLQLWLGALNRLVDAMDMIVDSRFKPKCEKARKGKIAGKAPSTKSKTTSNSATLKP